MTALAVAVLCEIAAPALAQSSGAPTTRPATQAEQLADRQALVLARLQRLEDRLFQLSQVLEKSEPENAARLLDALGASRNMLVRQRVEEIVASLRAARLSDAVDKQQAIQADLEQLLRLLLSDKQDDAERKEDLEALKALRERLNRLLEHQEAQLRDAQAAADTKKRLAEIEAESRRIEGLLGRQQDLNTRTGKADAARDAKALQAEQSELRQQTEQAAEHPAEVAAPTSAPATSSQPVSPADADRTATTRPASAAREPLRAAAEQMQQAEGALERNQPTDAGPPQQRAAEQLQKALDSLQAERQALESKLDLLRQAEAQRETAERTEDLAREMEGAAPPDGESGGDQSKPDGPGEQQGPHGAQDPQKGNEGQQGGKQRQQGQPDRGTQPNPSGKPPKSDKPAPGKQKVRDAVPHQKKAADELKQQKPSDATKEQQQAIDKLKEAKAELEDALEQIRREQQDEMLAALETRFAAMLARQIDINKKTNRLDAVGRAKWTRADQLELGAVAKDQGWVGDEADKALSIIREDGTTIATPRIVEELRDDARGVAKRLMDAETGADVRQVQEAIVATLQDLLDAVKELQKQRKQSEERRSQEGSPGEGNEPLMPGSAELKLLRSMQSRVNSLTLDLEKQRTLPQRATDDLQKRIEQAARRQRAVAEMTRDLVEGEQSRR